MSQNKFKVGDKVQWKFKGEGEWQPHIYTVVDSKYAERYDSRGVYEGRVEIGISYLDYKLVTSAKQKGESMFTETVTTTKIKEVIEGVGPKGALVSVQQTNENTVRLVIGARWEHAFASRFNKEGLEELISDLQKVADCLEDS